MNLDILADAEQSLAADGAIACFSSGLIPRGLNADRAPQLKAIVRHLPQLRTMRLLLFAILLLSCALSCRSVDAVDISDEDIVEAVFRFQIERCYEANPPKVYFLSLNRSDPTSDFMTRFKSSRSAVRKRSQMSGEFIDLESGERGIVLSVEKLTRLTAAKFEVEGACVAGGDNGVGFVYSVIREPSGVLRVGSRQKWIS